MILVIRRMSIIVTLIVAFLFFDFLSIFLLFVQLFFYFIDFINFFSTLFRFFELYFDFISIFCAKNEFTHESRYDTCAPPY